MDTVKRKILATFTLIVFGIFSLPFFAMAADESNYLVFKGGAYSPQSDDLEDLDTGFNGEISFGHYFNQNFALEVGIGYFETDGSFSGFDAILGNWTEDDEITAIPLTLTAIGISPLGDKVELFGKLGIGVCYVDGESDISLGVMGNVSFDDTDTTFGFHIGCGANFDITQNSFFRIEGKHLWASSEFEDTVLGVPIELDADLDGFTFTANIGIRF